MKALLLAAGFGTRLQPLTSDTPKCLVPIKGRPLLEYWLRLLETSEIQQALVNLHYLPEQVESFLQTTETSLSLKTSYEKELLGTGGTLLANEDYFSSEPVMVVHADNLSHFDINDFIESHRQRPKQTLGTMMTFSTSQPEKSGIVELDDLGVVQAFHEKVESPPGNLANAAVYIFEPEVFELLRSTGNSIIDLSTEIIPQLMGRLYTYHNGDYHRDIGDLTSYNIAQTEYPHSAPQGAL